MADEELLTISTTEDGDRLSVTVSGEVDSATSEQLEQVLVGLAQAPAPIQVVVDLTDVGFIDSSGLRALIIGQRALEGAGSLMTVGRASDAVVRLFDMTGLTQRFGLS